MNEKIVLFGAGYKRNEVIKFIERYREFEITELWDNNRLIWGEKVDICGISVPIRAPYKMHGYNIVISTDVYFDEIKNQLIEEFDIDEKQIKPRNYLYKNFKDIILKKYKNSSDKSLISICAYLQEHEIDMFNGQVTKIYNREMFDIFLDTQRGLLYSYWMGKKIYLSSDIKSKEGAKEYLCRLCKEQDESSPHSYQLNRLNLNCNDIVIDGGAAEGFFALQIIDKVGKIYLIEGDNKWLEALEYTFEPYRDKVVIVPKWLGKCSDRNTISIDQINKQDRVTLVKLDIEGAESDAIEGGQETFLLAQNMRVIACTYHRTDDADKFQAYFQDKGYKTRFSAGYLFAEGLEFIKPELRRGVIIALKG